MLVKSMIADMNQLNAMHPDVTILWSELLLRFQWHGAIKPSRSNYMVVKINQAIRSAITCFGSRVIQHMDIKPIRAELFRPDRVHLTTLGNEHWLDDVRLGLQDCLSDC